MLKKIWINAGPVLILVLMIYSMVYFTVEKLDSLSADTAQAADNGGSLPVDEPDAGVGLLGAETPDYRASGAGRQEGGWAISVGDGEMVYVATVDLAYEVLGDVKQYYMPGDDQADQMDILNMEFIETVEIWAEAVPLSELSTPEQAFELLTVGRDNLVSYTVKKGDSYWAIAHRNEMTVEELKEINGITNDNLQIGQVLLLNAPKPLLSVKTRIAATLQEDIPFNTIYKDNGNIWEGQSRVVTDGVAGTREIQCEIEQINGIAVEKIIIAETVISEPVDCVMERGTKTIVASRAGTVVVGSGALRWPVPGKIYSGFGPRGSGNHAGIDLEARTGDPVYSAQAGKVTAASWYYDYGNRVVVDHGDGLSTWYAHLSEFKVSVGQTVDSLELIGLSGSTGRTTAPHLHFEVRIDGKAVNPIHYLD